MSDDPRRDSLRDHLREATRHAHDRLDAVVSRFDLGTSAGLEAFVRLQHEGFTALREGMTPDTVPFEAAPTLEADLQRHISSAHTSLKSLGAEQSADQASDAPQIDRLAVAYMLYGSRAGLKLLRREWEKATDLRVLMAGSVFNQPSTSAAWTHLRDRLEQIPATDARAPSIVHDAISAFEMFHDLALRISRELAAPDAQAGNAQADAEGDAIFAGSGMVVEDDVVIALDTSDLLESMGAGKVHCASTVHQARQIMEKADIGYAVLDVNLRGETSAALAHSLRAARVPYVLASGEGDGSQIDGYPDSVIVAKPYDVSTLRRGLEAAVGKMRTSAATPAD
ncbi:response regulator receiver domain-containing protein [Brevirhabdus pacifica]|nr:biliverdin-producing heme oxygenase [Brevirhabdus pacifica]PJJ85641.1 response regulator receiver domain-containing protein [Brevirhabdus pacifica]